MKHEETSKILVLLGRGTSALTPALPPGEEEWPLVASRSMAEGGSSGLAAVKDRGIVIVGG